jgi:hypothetical protein
VLCHGRNRNPSSHHLPAANSRLPAKTQAPDARQRKARGQGEAENKEDKQKSRGSPNTQQKDSQKKQERKTSCCL